MLVIQTLTFVLPGIAAGLTLSIPFLIALSKLFEYFVGSPISTFPSYSGIIWSIVLGFFIPIFSLIYPIK